MGNDYNGILLKFMSYRDNTAYEDDHEFTREQLAAVTAQEVVDWFNYKAYNTRNPTAEDRPTEARSNSLYHWKKCLSYYMPNKHMQWDEITKRGNPTKSQALNKMTKKVVKFEVRGQGAPSKARRALRESEFKAIMVELHNSPQEDIISRYGMPALLAFQFHMIGRVDDVSKWMRENLRPHDAHLDKAAKACYKTNLMAVFYIFWRLCLYIESSPYLRNPLVI